MPGAGMYVLPCTVGPDDVWIVYPMIAPFTVPGESETCWPALGAKYVPSKTEAGLLRITSPEPSRLKST